MKLSIKNKRCVHVPECERETEPKGKRDRGRETDRETERGDIWERKERGRRGEKEEIREGEWREGGMKERKGEIPPPSLESLLSPVWDLRITLTQPDLAATAFLRSLPIPTMLSLEANEEPQIKMEARFFPAASKGHGHYQHFDFSP